MGRYVYKDEIEYELTSVCGEPGVTEIRDYDGWIRADLTTACKKHETAIRRLFRTLRYYEEAKCWEKCMIESCANGCYSMNDLTMADGSCNECPSYSWGVEEVQEGLFYIWLNLKKEQPEEEVTDYPHIMKEMKTVARQQVERLKRHRPDLSEKRIKRNVWLSYKKDRDNMEIIQHLHNLSEQPPTDFTILVEWSKNRNASATVRYGIHESYGGAYGYGYEKESAAVAEALNERMVFIKLLCDLKERALSEGKSLRPETSVTGVVPYYKGGVGMPTLLNLFRNAGYSVNEIHKKNTSVYTLTKEGKS